jgi:hypothetical protein
MHKAFQSLGFNAWIFFKCLGLHYITILGIDKVFSFNTILQAQGHVFGVNPYKKWIV